jgi:hypothetical protein
MATAQDFVNALRAGNYIFALQFYDFVRKKYSKIKTSSSQHSTPRSLTAGSMDLINNNQCPNIKLSMDPTVKPRDIGTLNCQQAIFDDDDLNQCLIYELLKTDIHTHDLPALNFLIKCIEGVESFKTGFTGKKMGGFTYAASMVCAIKEHASYLIFEKVTNSESFDAFMNPNSLFTQTIYHQRINRDRYTDLMYANDVLNPFNTAKVADKARYTFFKGLTHNEFIQYINGELDKSIIPEEHKPLLVHLITPLLNLDLQIIHLATRGHNKEASLLTGFRSHMRIAILDIILNPAPDNVEKISDKSETLLKYAQNSSLKHNRGVQKYLEWVLNLFSFGLNLMISTLRKKPTLKTRTIRGVEAYVRAMKLFKNKYTVAIELQEAPQNEALRHPRNNEIRHPERSEGFPIK